ncbi:trigger factor family protein [Candidatus Parcubacteria bacterium]|nr:trigger factor family protein [Candidatus Parcubacteria bacterium]
MNYENIKVKKLDTSEVEISGAIPVAALSKYRTKALKDIGENVTIPGFRKGHIPMSQFLDFEKATFQKKCLLIALVK